MDAEFTEVPQVSHIATQSGAFVDVLKNRPKLTTPMFTNPKPAHGVKHFVKTEGPPVFAHARHQRSWKWPKRSSQTLRRSG